MAYIKWKTDTDMTRVVWRPIFPVLRGWGDGYGIDPREVQVIPGQAFNPPIIWLTEVEQDKVSFHQTPRAHFTSTD